MIPVPLFLKISLLPELVVVLTQLYKSTDQDSSEELVGERELLLWLLVIHIFLHSKPVHTFKHICKKKFFSKKTHIFLPCAMHLYILFFFFIFSLIASNNTLQRRRWHPTPVLLPGKPHAWRSLVGCSSQGHKEPNTTERTPPPLQQF